MPDKSLSGDPEMNPWAFEPHSLQKVEWKVNGIPLQTRPLNLTQDNYLRAYTQFMRDLGLDSSINTINISLEDFKTRFMIITTDRIGCGCGCK